MFMSNYKQLVFVLIPALLFSALPARVAPHSHLSHLTAQAPHKKKKWTITILIHASNNLESFACKNIKEMMQVGSNENINILVELHKPGEQSWRYYIEKGLNPPTPDQIISRKTTKETSIEDEVVDTMRWATNNYPAEKHALIFWNHGIGILDPSWKLVEPHYMRQGASRTLGVSRTVAHAIPSDRGILFDDERKTYLTNNGMRRALKKIVTDPSILNGQKLEVVGMDACLMGMMEVMYQIKDYANHFVASEEFEYAQGWAYGALMSRISERTRGTQNIDGKEFCRAVVETFENYYTKRTKYFTQSAINLNKLEPLHHNMNAVSAVLIKCKQQDNERTTKIINQARCRCLAFSITDYIDLHSFYDELKKLVDSANSWVRSDQVILRNELKKLSTLLTQGKQLIVGTNGAVTANAAGQYLSRARGISVYFPQLSIDTSYLSTQFAKDNNWFDFLRTHLVRTE